jgi:hypothetical protein
MDTKKAVVLLSGGVDSTTTLAIARSQGFVLHALTFRYGQRHQQEIAAARHIAVHAGVAEHVIVDIDLRLFGGSALTADIAVPKGRGLNEISHGIPVTYVPARNTIFLSFALAWTEVLASSDIFIGVKRQWSRTRGLRRRRPGLAPWLSAPCPRGKIVSCWCRARRRNRTALPGRTAASCASCVSTSARRTWSAVTR